MIECEVMLSSVDDRRCRNAKLCG